MTAVPSASRADRITLRLTEALAPATVTVHDDSARHAGHAGVDTHGETHYRVRVVSPALAGLTRVARHRRIMTLLADEFATGLHALVIDARTPEELLPA